MIAESCCQQLEIVSGSGEVFAYCFPVAARLTESSCPAAGSTAIGTDNAGVGNGYQPGTLEMQQLGPFGWADVAAPGETVPLVEGRGGLVKVASRLALFEPGCCWNGRELGGCVDIHECRDIVGAQARVYDDKAPDISKGDRIYWISAAPRTRPSVRGTCEIVKAYGICVIDGIVMQEFKCPIRAELVIRDSHSRVPLSERSPNVTDIQRGTRDLCGIVVLCNLRQENAYGGTVFACRI
jgi:hypothetical protein